MSEPRYRCRACRWVGVKHELLTGDNPFDKTEKIYGCPECFSIDDFAALCDEPGCLNDVSCGFPTPSGYRQTCPQHATKS